MAQGIAKQLHGWFDNDHPWGENILFGQVLESFFQSQDAESIHLQGEDKPVGQNGFP